MSTILIGGVPYEVNGRGVVDLTGRYNIPKYQDPATDWTLDRSTNPVVALSVHHWAGWYGPKLPESAASTPAQEVAQIDACALDHRTRFGIGPGYWYVGFPSGRVYAVGKFGTHRASVAGREPANRRYWNTALVALALAGNYDTELVTSGVARAVATGIEEMRALPGVAANAPIYPHRATPTVNSAGVSFAQDTNCPGDQLAAWLASRYPLGAPAPQPPAAPPFDMAAVTALLTHADAAIVDARYSLVSAEAAIGSGAADLAKIRALIEGGTP